MRYDGSASDGRSTSSGHRVAGDIVCRCRDSTDEQAGDLQLCEDVCRVPVVGETGRRTGAHHSLTGHAEQEMPLTGAEGREHLAGDLVGHCRGSPAQTLSGHHRVLRAAHGTRGQDENGAPAPASLDQGADDLGIRCAQVRSHHRRGLGIVHSQDVSAKDVEVAEELGHEAGQGQVPPARQQQPDRLRVLAEALVDEAHGGGRQGLRVVDHDQPSTTPGFLGRGVLEHTRQPLRCPAGVGVEPDGTARAIVTAISQPSCDAERLSRAHGPDQEGDRGFARLVEALPQAQSWNVVPGKDRDRHCGRFFARTGSAGRGDASGRVVS